jgi:hypothetical protein
VSAAELDVFLQALIAYPSLRPQYSHEGDLIATYCNFGAKRNLPGESFTEFEAKDLDADGMYAIMTENKSGKWRKITGKEAAAWAMEGNRVHGCLPSHRLNEKHGHIVWIWPAPCQMSGSLGLNVPLCANIGKGDPTLDLVTMADGTQTKFNWGCKISQAFPVHVGEPDYFVYVG